jgi:endonuclease/exonuclease/phosphatase (EEP) superfamily protein YafD
LLLLPALLAYFLLVINAVLLGYQMLWIFPFTWLASKQVKNADAIKDVPTLTVITSNVLTPNRSSYKLLELVKQHQPDVLVTLESDKWWENELKPLHEEYRYRVAKPQDNLYGMHVYSKHKLENVKVVDLIKKDIPSIHCELVLDDSIRIKCHFLHPEPPSPTESKTAKPRDSELLLVANRVEPKRHLTIVTGDLNDVAWSPTTRAFRKQSGLLDPRIGRGFFNTFHAQYIFARWPLDHIFHSSHFRLIELKRLPSIDSDHFPLFSSFSINKN